MFILNCSYRYIFLKGIWLPNAHGKTDFYQPFLGLIIADLKEEKLFTLQYMSWTRESGM